MKKHIKKYLLPHKDNDFKPHFLRKESLAFIVVLLVVFEIALLTSMFTVFKNSNFLAAVLPSTLVSLTNANRVNYNLGELKENPILAQAALLKAQDMAAKGYFAHTSPEGLTPWHWLDKAGYEYLYAGENLAVNFFESKDVSDAWMRSPAHKENIVSKNYSEIGIATAQGIYKGQQATFVVQFFGEPAPVLAPPKNVAQKPKVDVLPVPKPTPVPTPAPIKVVKTAPAPVKTETPAEERSFQASPAPMKKFSSIFTQVKGDSTAAEQNRPIIRILESPRTAMATMVLAALILLIIVLALAILIEIKIQHPKMIIGTLLVILVAIGILYINSRVFTPITELPTDTNYAAVFKAF